MADTTKNRLNISAVTNTIAVNFPVQGTRLPADHGFALYSAISKIIPELHEAKDFGVELISGVTWDSVSLPLHSDKILIQNPAIISLSGRAMQIEKRAIFHVKMGLTSA
jgi:hypothetical protein